MIDCHTHIITAWREKPFTEEHLLQKMDQSGIEKFVLLPIGASPEVSFFSFGTEDVLGVYKRHPDRVIPFCNIDPRAGSNSPDSDFSWILTHYKKQGCRGLGELMANMYIDEPRCKNLFRQCGKTGFPVLFHLSGKIGGCYGLVDDIYLPRLETVLKGCPETIFIGHAMGFWSEISSDVAEETRNGYPKGSVTAPGRLQDLMQKYPNLYGDLSADSGFNALTRDSEYGYKFLNDFQNRLLFGTDLCRINQEMPIVEYFRKGLEKGKISKAVYDKITKRNIKKLLNIKPYG